MITNFTKDAASEVSNRIEQYLKAQGKEVNCNRICAGNEENCITYTDYKEIPDDTDCVVVIGGDGTMLQAARDLKEKDIPMIGVNLGKLGFLAEIEQDVVEDTLGRLCRDEYVVESRMMLAGSVWRKGTCIYEDIALNDIVTGRSNSLRVIDFKVYVNEQFLNLYSADGMIISTPTGSTAYNLSAGGPILEPCASIISITPICAHALGARSIVLSADSVIRIEICEDRHMEELESMAYFDGNVSIALQAGDIIEIRKSELDTKILKLNHMSFVEILHKKF